MWHRLLAEISVPPLRHAMLLDIASESSLARSRYPASVLDTNLNEEPAKPDAVVSGPAYRGVVRRADRIVWSCPHTHFTDHSARACAAGHLQRTERDRPGNMPAL